MQTKASQKAPRLLAFLTVGKTMNDTDDLPCTNQQTCNTNYVENKVL
jgi:hypothetical protein